MILNVIHFFIDDNVASETRVSFLKTFVDCIKVFAGKRGTSEADVILEMVKGTEQGKTLEEIVKEIARAKLSVNLDGKENQRLKLYILEINLATKRALDENFVAS